MLLNTPSPNADAYTIFESIGLKRIEYTAKFPIPCSLVQVSPPSYDSQSPSPDGVSAVSVPIPTRIWFESAGSIVIDFIIESLLPGFVFYNIFIPCSSIIPTENKSPPRYTLEKS